MKQAVIVLVVMTIFLGSLSAGQIGGQGDLAAIQAAIWDFLNGSVNLSDVDAVTRNLHPDYLRLDITSDDALYGISLFAFMSTARVNKLMFPDRKINETIQFSDIRAIGNIGFADIDRYRDGALHGTNYFFLMKFENGWKLVGSIEQYHISQEARAADTEKDKAAIKKMIQEAYVDGLQNWGDMDVVRRGIHENFAMLGIRGNGLTRSGRDPWIANVEKLKKENPGGSKTKVTVNFLDVRTVGQLGFARFETLRDGKPAYLDMMLLLKFKDGWKIVLKQFHSIGR